VFDKGRSPGGRLATRRIGAATLDHGAQFFTVRTAEFESQVAAWRERGLVDVWHHGLDEPADGHPRFRAAGGMNRLARDLAAGLDVRCDSLVFAVHRVASGWEVVLDDASVHHADAVVLTCPTPQSFALLFEVGVDVPMDVIRADYDRTIALLAVLDGPSAVPAPGAVQRADTDAPDGAAIFSFVADNAAKGISAAPALTLHASPTWSEAHWDADAAETHRALLDAAATYVGDARVVESQVKRWRFATPRRTWPDPCWVSPEGTLVLAGDAFAGPRVEGAYVSGLAAARAVG
jgi:predicted NAD/FAD-dependent oxidoreductase